VRVGSIRMMARRERSEQGTECGWYSRRPDGAERRSRSEAVGAIGRVHPPRLCTKPPPRDAWDWNSAPPVTQESGRVQTVVRRRM